MNKVSVNSKAKTKKKRSSTPDSNSRKHFNQEFKEHFELDNSFNSNNPNNLIIEDTMPMPNLKFSELLFNVNDDFKTLITKNTKLRSMLIEANNHINEITKQFDKQLISHSNEKKSLLLQLDKITSNYTLYAESHKNLTVLKEEYDKVNYNFQLNQEKINVYKELIK